jgi:hypothetical protein
MNDIIFVNTNKSYSDKNWRLLKSRFIYAKKITVSSNKLEDIFKEASKVSLTKCFWVVMDNVSLSRSFKFDYKIKEWNKKYIHAWSIFKIKNKLFNTGVYCINKDYDTKLSVKTIKKIAGADFTKNSTITSKDIFYITKNLENSKGRFDNVCKLIPNITVISNNNLYDAYLEAIQRSTTDMFWVVWDNLELKDDFSFEILPHYSNIEYTHVFKNKIHHDGVTLFSKSSIVSKREIEYRSFVKKKEINIQSSTKVYDKFYITNDLDKIRNISNRDIKLIFNNNLYDAYLEAIQRSTTDMFWVVWDDLNLKDNFKFDFEVPIWDTGYTHVFKNKIHYDGVTLLSKHAISSKKEIEYRSFVKKKEINIQSSTKLPFDIVFISYNESYAEENYKKLLLKYPTAKRIHGVKGIHKAHIEAAKIADSKMFWVVDADALILDSFDFNYEVASWDYNVVHVWRSRNPINNLEYGYGGIKLLPTHLTLNMDLNKTDMTTSISPLFRTVEEVSNITYFNTDPFSTWRSAFRECVKLSSNVIDRQDVDETTNRLNVWCTEGKNSQFGEWAILGAIQGKEYGSKNIGNNDALILINDYDWLLSKFKGS